MIKRILIFSLFVWIGLLSTYAQTEAPVVNYPQFEKGYVYLKNGEIIKGKYIYSSNLDKIRAMIRSGFCRKAVVILSIRSKVGSSCDR